MPHLCGILYSMVYVTVNENYGFQRYTGLYCYDARIHESPQDTEYDCYRFCEVYILSFYNNLDLIKIFTSRIFFYIV